VTCNWRSAHGDGASSATALRHSWEAGY